ncbi:hypothetical protein JB92DRAFT_2879453 [Gautieria morchelliformis]|nr:hypothetical protein JB92DRAFT_2879453 [Gautieria morchelliformis]
MHYYSNTSGRSTYDQYTAPNPYGLHPSVPGPSKHPGMYIPYLPQTRAAISEHRMDQERQCPEQRMANVSPDTSAFPARTNNLGQPPQSEYHHFVRRDFPQSAQKAGNGAEYLRCQETGPPYLPQESSTNSAPEGVAQELGPMSCSVAPSGEIDWTSLPYAEFLEYFSVQETRDMSLGAPAYHGNISCSYDSGGKACPDGGPNMPTIETEHYYYNQGDAWTTTATPPAAKNVASLMAGSRAMQPDPVPDSPSRVTANTRRTRLEDGSADIPPTQKKGKSKPEHDLSDEQEVLCPEGCMRNGYPRTYVRRDTLRKHLMESCKGRIGDKPRLDNKAIDALVLKAFPLTGSKYRRRT